MYFKIKWAKNNEVYFTINAANNQVLCTSETYKQKQSALNAINVIKRGAATARVIDEATSLFKKPY